jgi:hypothetical protein
MKLWKLKRIGGTKNYCETDGLVIAANDETEAREIALDDFGANNHVWTNSNLSTCEEIIAKNTKRGIILWDHHHG